MKVVLPVHHFPPRYNAGAELYTFRLARWLLARGHAVEVVCVEAIDRGRSDALEVEADHYDGIPVWRLSFNLIAAPDRRRMDYENPLLNGWFRQYLERTRPDLVHFQAGYLIGAAPLQAAVAAGLKTILTLHDYWFLCPRITLQRGDGSLCETIPADPAGCAWCRCQEQRRYRVTDQVSAGLIGRALQSTVLRSAAEIVAGRRAALLPALALPDVVIAPSQFLADRFAPYVPAERLVVSRYGLDLVPFQAVQRPPADGTLRIGFIGQVARHKGVHLLIEAFRQIDARGRPIALHIYGGLERNPQYVSELRRLASHDPRIYFEGRFENSRVAEILKGLDLTVVPSTWYENSPLAIMESQAAGTPVLTAALGGMAELVHDGVDGLHFTPSDSADLARQLQRIIDEPGLLPSLRASIVAPRSIDDEMEQVLTIYAGVCAGAGSYATICG